MISPRLVRDDKPVERVAAPALPGRLLALVAAVHGAEAVQTIELPARPRVWSPTRCGTRSPATSPDGPV